MFEFNPTFDLSNLNGQNGFAMNGDASGDSSGKSLSAIGDVNGDGIVDIIIGAPYVALGGSFFYAGSSYVVFGKRGAWNASLELSTLNGQNGFVINGAIEHGYSGYSVNTAGDVNGDGIVDIIIGAPNADSSYVVFGKKGVWNESLELSALDGQNGFVVNGVADAGHSVSTAGDINGDGIADIIIGAIYAFPGGRYNAGSSYVVFGKKTAWNASIALSALSGKNGFSINGVAPRDESGGSVSTAGDVNGDGIADIIIGAFAASSGSNYGTGASYVVFGKKTAWDVSLELSALNGQNGFVINEIAEHDYSGCSVSTAGDVNGDGIADIIIGALFASPGGRHNAGSSYIVFGKKEPWSASFELSALNGQNGFVINGIAAYDNSGVAVNAAGDVNGDGIADVIIGARVMYRGDYYYAGASYVVFGKKTPWNTSVELSELNGQNGFAIYGISNGDFAGNSVSTAGDINGDGITDILIGAYGALRIAGSSYVVFGQSSGPGFFSHRTAAQSIEASANLSLQP